MWYVYIIRCGNDALYTGVTTDPERRFREHQTARGAKYTRAHKAEALVYREEHATQSSALKREAQIKEWSRKKKLSLIKH